MKDNRAAYEALIKFYPLTLENLDGEDRIFFYFKERSRIDAIN